MEVLWCLQIIQNWKIIESKQKSPNFGWNLTDFSSKDTERTNIIQKWNFCLPFFEAHSNLSLLEDLHHPSLEIYSN